MTTSTRLVVREQDKGEEQGPALWCEWEPLIIPNIGHAIGIYSNPLDVHKWDPEVLAEKKALNGRRWRVVDVYHEYTRPAIDKVIITAFVYVEEINKPTLGGPNGN